MGFEIGKNVQSSDVTLKQLQEQFKKEKDKDSIVNIFNKFNTNQTANADGEQVLDQTEQAAMMAFFKQVAGGKKDDTKDTKVSRSDVRNFKKNNKGNDFAKGLSYKGMKKMMSSFDATVNNTPNDNQTITYSNEANSGVRTIKIGDKEYKIDENNQVTDADGVKYEYENGQLQKIQNGNTTTSFKEGKRNTDVKTENGVTTTTTYNAQGNYKKSETVADTTNNTTTETEYGQKNIPARQTVTSHGGKLKTITYFMPDGKNARIKETTDKTTEGQTVVTTDSGGTRKVKTTKTNQSDYSKEENFTLAQDGTATRTTSTEKNNGVTTKTDYKKKKRTIADTKNNTDTEITFNSFDEKSGDITEKERTVTDKTHHSRTTINAGSKTKIIETLDDNNKTVKRTATIDTAKHTATIEVNGKKIKLNTDSQGNILANAKFTGSRMETVGEAAIRLGYAKDSEEYKTIVKANGGADARIAPGKGIKISQSVKNINKINLETAEVDANAQVKAHKAHQAKVVAEKQAKAKLATINERIKNSNTRAAELAKNIPGAKGGVRQTYATAKHKVYCDNLYNISNQGYQKNKAQGDWQQHYVYNPITDKMVPLESVMDNNKQLKNAKVMYITENGYARLTDGRTIHISFDNFDNQMTKYVETLQTNYEASVEDLNKDAALSRANMEKAKAEAKQAEEEKNIEKATPADTGYINIPGRQLKVQGRIYNNGNNYLYKDTESGTKMDADAVLSINGNKYLFKHNSHSRTLDYYDIQGRRTSFQNEEHQIMTKDGLFDVNGTGYNSSPITLEAYGSNGDLNGYTIAKITGTDGQPHVVFKNGDTCYDANKLLTTGKKVQVPEFTEEYRMAHRENAPSNITYQYDSYGNVHASINGKKYTAFGGSNKTEETLLSELQKQIEHDYKTDNSTFAEEAISRNMRLATQQG